MDALHRFLARHGVLPVGRTPHLSGGIVVQARNSYGMHRSKHIIYLYMRDILRIGNSPRMISPNW